MLGHLDLLDDLTDRSTVPGTVLPNNSDLLRALGHLRGVRGWGECRGKSIGTRNTPQEEGRWDEWLVESDSSTFVDIYTLK